ncbi:hypothetical protein [Brevibacillus choshinensis]|uniref:hypothetical protein n=1 Tax=Brevibacillus choshinensis TaxID=54911 RepID=UPI002E22B1ED|nr:hypothetical protein [Brevibacillus choshinensis]
MWWNDTFLAAIKPTIEIFYLAGGVVLAVVGFFGLKQIKIGLDQVKNGMQQVETGMQQVAVGLEQVHLLKYDIETRNKRMAVEKAMEFIEKFTDLIVQWRGYNDKLRQDGIEIQRFHVADFNEPKFTKPEYEHVIQKKHVFGGTDFINRLELFSSAFISGLADEEIAFQPVGALYCTFIQENYDLLCYYRHTENAPFHSLIQLYTIWDSRIQQQSLHDQISKLEKAKEQIPITQSVKPIGVKD